MALDWRGGSHEESINDLIVRKKYARAIELLRLHLQRRGRSPVVRLQLADTLVMAGRGGEAVPIFLGLADEFAADGFVAKAVAALKRVEKIEPGRPDVEARLKGLTRRQMTPTARPNPVAPTVSSSRDTEIGIEEVGSATWTRLQRQGRPAAGEGATDPPSEGEAGPKAGGAPAPRSTPDDEAGAITSVAPGGGQNEATPSGPVGEQQDAHDGGPSARPTAAPKETSPALTARIRGVFRRFLALLPVPAGAEVGPEPEAPPLPDVAAPVPETDAVPTPEGLSVPPRVEAGPALEALAEPASAEDPGGREPAPDAQLEPPEPETPAREQKVEPPELFLELPPAEATPAGASADEELPNLEIEEPEPESSLVAASRSDAEDEGLPPLEIDDNVGETAAPLASALDEDRPPPAPVDAVVSIESASTPSGVSPGGTVTGTGKDDFFGMPEEAFQDRVTDLIGELLQPADAAAPILAGTHETPIPASPLSLLGGPFLEDLTEEERLSVLQGLRLRSVEAGDIILTEGEAGQSLFLLTTGEVKVFARDPTGHNVRIGVLKEGDVFGEISVLQARPRTATITAAARGELLELDQESLSRLARDHPRVMARIDAFSRERSDDREAAAVRAGARPARRAGADLGPDLDVHFGGKRLEPRLRLRLADAFLKAGEDRQAVQILIALADDLVQHDFIEKAVALLKKVEEIQRRRAAEPQGDGVHTAPLLGRRPPAPPDLLPAGGDPAVSDRFQDWLLDLVRATVQRRLGGPPPMATRLLDTTALRAYGRGLLASRLFKGLSEEELLAVIQGLRLLTFEPGDIVLTEGEAGGAVFILATGRVRVFVRNRSGQDVAIDELGEGAFFGEMAAISSRSRAATVTAASACTLLELDGPTLRSILQSYPAVRDVLEHVFIERATDPHAASVRGLEGR
jgi:CRP-like cAMP-binding protein